MAGFSGLASRISERLKALGFWKNGHPDVARFCHAKGYRPQYVYAWLKGRVPGSENLEQLAIDLEAPVAWLLLGEAEARGAMARVVAVGARGSTRVIPRRDRGRSGDRPLRSSETPAVGVARVVDFVRLREATDKVVEVQAELEAFVQAFPDSWLWVDEHGVVLDGMAGAASTLEIGPKTRGRRLREVCPSSAAAPLLRALGQAFRTNALVTLEVPASEGNQERTWEARLLPVKTTSARPRKALVIVRDISDRKRAESALRERESQYRGLVEGSGNGLCIHRNGAIEFANRAMARMFGYADVDRLVGTDLRKLMPQHPMTAARPGGAPTRARFEGIRTDGETVSGIALATQVSWKGSAATLLTLLPHVTRGAN